MSRSYFGKLFRYGFASYFCICDCKYEHGIRLLPIVGSPLPIMSYGGSSMLATMIGLAIVMSTKIHHKQVIN